MTEFSASFEIDVEHLKALGVVDPNSPKSLDIFASGKLNSNERLYFSLWGNKFLSSASFEAKKKIFQQGEDVAVAYFIVSGSLLAVNGQIIERLGPGSVLCLAEGLAGLPALNVPVGFSAQGLPMGMQLIGQPQGEVGLLSLGLAYEEVVGDWLSIKPPSPKLN